MSILNQLPDPTVFETVTRAVLHSLPVLYPRRDSNSHFTGLKPVAICQLGYGGAYERFHDKYHFRNVFSQCCLHLINIQEQLQCIQNDTPSAKSFDFSWTHTLRLHLGQQSFPFMSFFFCVSIFSIFHWSTGWDLNPRLYGFADRSLGPDSGTCASAARPTQH